MSIKSILKQFNPTRDNLLLILHALQDSHPQQYLTEEALEQTAVYLKLTKSSVYGVAKYYSMFSLVPRGKYIIRVCGSAVCELRKSNEILSQLQSMLGIKPGETTPCGQFTLEISECLGQCQEAPSMLVNKDVYNELDAVRVRQIIDDLRIS